MRAISVSAEGVLGVEGVPMVDLTWTNGRTIRLTAAALACVEETGADVVGDVAALNSGEYTIASLLEHCLSGADADRERGWREYVDCLVSFREGAL